MKTTAELPSRAEKAEPIFHSTGVWKPRPRKGYIFGQFVNKRRYFIIWAFDRDCKKMFKVTLNHYNKQKLFMFPIILLFLPNNEDRQNLNIEQSKLNENNRHGKQNIERAKTLQLHLIPVWWPALMRKTIKLVRPFQPFQLFSFSSIFRFCRSSLFGSKRSINSFCMS